MADNTQNEETQKSLIDTIADSFVEKGGTVIWESTGKSKKIIMMGEYQPELVILTQEGLGVRVASVNGRCNANGHPARIYYDSFPFVKVEKKKEEENKEEETPEENEP